MSNINVGTKVRDNGKGYPSAIGTEQVGTVIGVPGHESLYFTVKFKYDAEKGEAFEDGYPSEWMYTEDELIVVVEE